MLPLPEICTFLTPMEKFALHELFLPLIFPLFPAAMTMLESEEIYHLLLSLGSGT